MDARVAVGDKVLLSRTEAARVLGCSVKLVGLLVLSGELETRTLPGASHPKVTRASIDRYVGAPGRAEGQAIARRLAGPVESPWDKLTKQWRAEDEAARRAARAERRLAARG